MTRTLALLRKELTDLRHHPGIFLPAVLTGLIAFSMPFLIAIVIPATLGEPLSGISQGTGVHLTQSGLEPEAREQAMLFQLAGDHAKRQRGAIDWREAEIGQQVWDRANVVLVPVGQQDRLDLILLLAQVGDVGQHKIDAQHLGFREHHAAIEQQDLVAVFEHPHVAPNLAGSAERNDAQSVLCHRLL